MNNSNSIISSNNINNKSDNNINNNSSNNSIISSNVKANVNRKMFPLEHRQHRRRKIGTCQTGFVPSSSSHISRSSCAILGGYNMWINSKLGSFGQENFKVEWTKRANLSKCKSSFWSVYNVCFSGEKTFCDKLNLCFVFWRWWWSNGQHTRLLLWHS